MLTFVLTRLAQEAESIDAEAVQVDTQAAVETLQTLQSQLEDVSGPSPEYQTTKHPSLLEIR
jgi:membrane protein involved in colicin uptake